MSEDLRAQVIELQTQLAFQEDLLSALDHRVASQDREIQRLTEAVLQLQSHSRLLQNALSEQGIATLAEKPPHY